MKKILILSELLLLSGCADTALLGYEDSYFLPTSEKDITVYYDSVPQNCKQIGMTVLTVSPFWGNLKKEIQELREEAAKIGGNHVNIQNYTYFSGLFSANAYHMTGTIYRCQKQVQKYNFHPSTLM